MSDLSSSTPVLLVFSDDWGRHPSSCQHLVRHLLRDHKVLWVNTIGMRTPSFDLSTVRRGLEKAFHWFRRSKQATALPPKLQVVNPRMWPWFTSARDRSINRRLLLRSLTRLIEAQDAPVTAITTIPIVADLVGELRVQEWVYYCVDDFSVWPGLDQRTMLSMEADLIPKADRIIAVSETLQHRIESHGRESDLLTHGVDTEFWSRDESTKLSGEIDALTRPLVTFWGVVDRRLDTSFIRMLSADLEVGTILLVGPTQDPNPALAQLPNVHIHPPLAFESLPSLASATDVLIMPYSDSEVTRAMQPLKLKEYLSTGKATVVRRLPSTVSWSDCLDIASTAQEFSRIVRARIAHGLDDAQAVARERLHEESWVSKAEQFRRLALTESAAGV